MSNGFYEWWGRVGVEIAKEHYWRTEEGKRKLEVLMNAARGGWSGQKSDRRSEGYVVKVTDSATPFRFWNTRGSWAVIGDATLFASAQEARDEILSLKGFNLPMCVVEVISREPLVFGNEERP